MSYPSSSIHDSTDLDPNDLFMLYEVILMTSL